MLKLPTILFDGTRHNLSIEIEDVAADQRAIGTMSVLLPSRPPPASRGDRRATDSGDILAAVFSYDGLSADQRMARYREDLTAVLAEASRIYDHATALAFLYVHVLRRRIDEEGLRSRMTRLSLAPAELGAIVREVLESAEFDRLYGLESNHRLPSVDLLRVWIQLRKPLEVPRNDLLQPPNS